MGPRSFTDEAGHWLPDGSVSIVSSVGRVDEDCGLEGHAKGNSRSESSAGLRRRHLEGQPIHRQDQPHVDGEGTGNLPGPSQVCRAIEPYL